MAFKCAHCNKTYWTKNHVQPKAFKSIRVQYLIKGKTKCVFSRPSVLSTNVLLHALNINKVVLISFMVNVKPHLF